MAGPEQSVLAKVFEDNSFTISPQIRHVLTRNVVPIIEQYIIELKDGEAACLEDPQNDEEVKQEVLKELPQFCQQFTNPVTLTKFHELLHQYQLIIKRELCESSYLESEKIICQRIEAGDNDATKFVQLFQSFVVGPIDYEETKHFLLSSLKAISKKQHTDDYAAFRNLMKTTTCYFIEEVLAGEALPIGAVISYDPLFCLPLGKLYNTLTYF